MRNGSSAPHHQRLKVVLVCFYGALSLVITRLFYWQVIKASDLQADASDQYRQTKTQVGSRGEIFTSDGYLIVGNEPVYRLFAQPHVLTQPPDQVASLLTPILAAELDEVTSATDAGIQKEITRNIEDQLKTKLTKPNTKWIALQHKLSKETKEKIAQLDIKGLGFDEYEARWYPEASMAAHLTGFVGKDQDGYDIGYFGVEGALEKELKGRTKTLTTYTDALGLRLLGSTHTQTNPTGRTITLTIRRDIQKIASEMLLAGMQKYEAKSGEVIIMEPSTGKILAMAAYPNYDPGTFFEFPAEHYKNPSAASSYEPGSTFKTLTVAAGIDKGVIKPDTQCPVCAEPRVFGKYTIKTWNNEYHPNTTITEALAHSDNTAMMYITDLLGAETFSLYLKNFGIGQPTNIELQEDTSPPFPTKWGPVELATSSFGQGISVTSLQLVKAVNAIANQGKVMQPQIIEKVRDPETGEEVIVQPHIERTVIKPETAGIVTEMMVQAATAGEAKWTASKTRRIAGKTGTSQVAVDGKYDEDKTIATFIGFTPPEKPKFIMLVKLTEPGTSPWAAETAAPLWYRIAEKLYLLLNIPPDPSAAGSV